MLKFERQLASAETFHRRLLRGGTLALGFIAVSLAIGMAGYAGFEGLGWIDSARPPDCRPKSVPRSHTRLNST